MPDQENNFALVKKYFSKLSLLNKDKQKVELEKLQGDAVLQQKQFEILKNMLQADSGTSIATNIQSVSEKIVGQFSGENLSFEQKQIGPYKIIKAIGEGGMGQVYLAERNDGVFEQQVALKLPHSNFNPQMLQRFENERQILAQLTHNNIAHLLDGGTTQNNQPYLVMEYIQGKNIDDYCIENIPNLHERLKLILQICSAVTFSHQQLVLHRDLKPSNILVTNDGLVKLLDFGIAKLLDLDEETQAKNTATQIMTRYYASPEQLQGKPASTHSDLFSLAIIAYELITGYHPFKHENQHEREKNLISGKVMSVTQRTDNSEALLPELAKIPTGKIQGDLENILFKALSVEPEKRYASINGFADDLTNFIENKPVKARKPSRAYYISKWVQRHKTVTALAFVTLFTLSIATLYSINKAQFAEQQRQQAVKQKVIAESESEKSQLISDFMQSLFKKARPKKGTKDITAQNILDQGIVDLQDNTEIFPESKFQLMNVMFKSYLQLNKNISLRKVMNKMYLQCTSELSEKDWNCIETLGLLAFLEHTTGNDLTSLQYYKKIEDTIRKINPIKSEYLANILRNQFSPLVNVGKEKLAKQKTLEAIQIYKSIPNIDKLIAILAYNDLIVSDIIAENFSTMEEDLQERYDMLIQAGYDDTEKMAEHYHLWAAYYIYTHKAKEAHLYQHKAVEISEIHYQLKNSRAGLFLKSMGMFLFRDGKPEKAVVYTKKALHFFQDTGNGNEYQEVKTLNNLVMILLANRQFKEALVLLDKLKEYNYEFSAKRVDLKCNLELVKTQFSVFKGSIFKADELTKKFKYCTTIDHDKKELYLAYWQIFNAQIQLRQGNKIEANEFIQSAYKLFEKYPEDYLGLKILVKSIKYEILHDLETS